MIRRLLRRAVEIEDGEVGPAVWACVYCFFVLASFYVLRPLREEMGIGPEDDFESLSSRLATLGGELLVLVFIVVIIGGLGSVTGCFIGALLVALATNYAGFLVPKLALITDIALMVAVLLWRPRGLYPVTSR